MIKTTAISIQLYSFGKSDIYDILANNSEIWLFITNKNI